MKKNGLSLSFITLVVFLPLSGGGLVIAHSSGSDERPVTVIERGQLVYERNCAICHGTLGDGRGMVAMMLRTKPRDFRPGIFKFRSTPTGSPPTDEDLFHTISQGLRGTGMVAQDHLPETERRAVVEYLKTFSERFQKQRAQAPIPIPEPPPRTPDLIAKGRKLFEEAGCFTCHGIEARGDGPLAEDLKDYWGYPSRPADLTRLLQRGSAPRAIYLTLVTGLDGTPMPSWQAALSEEEIWALAHYVSSLNTDLPSQGQVREEQAGQMVLRMHGGRSPGMMPRMPMR